MLKLLEVHDVIEVLDRLRRGYEELLYLGLLKLLDFLKFGFFCKDQKIFCILRKIFAILVSYDLLLDLIFQIGHALDLDQLGNDLYLLLSL